jgi:PAS domain S-box-containing protein
MGQGFMKLLDSVFQTGRAVERRGERIFFQRTAGGPMEERYLDFVYQPNRDPAGAIIGVFVQGVDVTERELAEVSARRLASIVDSSDDAIVGHDLSSIVTSWNAGAERIFGYSAQEMIGQSFKRIVPANLQQQEDEILARISNGQRVEHLETTRQTKDGELRDVSVTISPIKDSAGSVVGISRVARDVTERKRAESMLRASEQRFRQLWTTTTDAIVIMDADQRIEYANPAVEQVFGFTPEEVMTGGLTLLMPERLHEAHRQGMKRYLATGKRKLDWRATEIPALHKGGYEFPLEIGFSHFHEEGRDLFAAFMRDITDRKQAQEALQRSESLFRELADAMPNIVWAAQPNGEVDYYNRRWYEFTGRQRMPAVKRAGCRSCTRLISRPPARRGLDQ